MPSKSFASAAISHLERAYRDRSSPLEPFVPHPWQKEPEGDWSVWLTLCGRGAGKTRLGAEMVKLAVQRGHKWIGIVGQTAADVRDICIEGESGLLSVYAHSDPMRPTYEPSKQRVTWPNGARANVRSGEDPDAVRGLQFTWLWADEMPFWAKPEPMMVNLFLGNRLKHPRPRAVLTNTPTPLPYLRKLMADPMTRVSRASTFDNAANLSGEALEGYKRAYDGTRIGRQELYGEILDDNPSALWEIGQIDALRIPWDKIPRVGATAIGVDPATTSTEGSDLTGIVIAGLCDDGTVAVFGDHTGRYKPAEIARIVCGLASAYPAPTIVYESNQGGDFVRAAIETENKGRFSVVGQHSHVGKRLRAEPVSALYEQRRVRHVGKLEALESEMCSWDPYGNGDSPNRVDALVFAVRFLATGGSARGEIQAGVQVNRLWRDKR